MLSFDFAANILLPNLINNPAFFYFNKRRTNAILGVNFEDYNF